MRFIATADWQLGMTAHFLNDEARARFHQARLDAVVRIGELVSQHDAEFVVVGGDVFESNQLSRSIVLRAFEALRSIPVPVVLLPGNHDPLDAASLYRDASFLAGVPPHVRVLTDSTPVEVVPGVEVVGAPWFSKRPEMDLVAAACSGLTASSKVPRVLVGHGAVASLNPDQESLAVIDDAALATHIEQELLSFAILGDRHSTTRVAAAIWYPGSPEVTNYRETDPGNVLLVDLDHSVPQVQRLRTGRWSFRVVEHDLASAADIDHLLAELDQIEAKDRVAVWLVLRGTISVALNARLEAELATRQSLFARLDSWGRHTDLAVLPDGHDFSETDLTGFAADAVSELVDLAATDPVARDALALLYRLTGAGR